MNRFALALLVLVSTLLNAQSPNKNPNKSEPPILGPHRARGVPKPATTNSNDMLYHGGPILPTASVQAIFWGSSWGTNPGDEITRLSLSVPAEFQRAPLRFSWPTKLGVPALRFSPTL